MYLLLSSDEGLSFWSFGSCLDFGSIKWSRHLKMLFIARAYASKLEMVSGSRHWCTHQMDLSSCSISWAFGSHNMVIFCRVHPSLWSQDLMADLLNFSNVSWFFVCSLITCNVSCFWKTAWFYPSLHMQINILIYNGLSPFVLAPRRQHCRLRKEISCLTLEWPTEGH